MANEWYYAENGESFGPLSGDEMLKRIGQSGDEPLFVWKEGMSGWTDARETPELAAALRKKTKRTGFLQTAQQSVAKARQGLAEKQIAERARHEFISYLAVSTYLFVWFTAVLFYKSAILRSVGVPFAPFALAAVKALVLGKFMLVLEAFKFGESQRSQPLIVDILKKALLFTLALFALSIVEEIIVGYFHGRGVVDSLKEVGGGSALQALAAAILMFLALMPYLAFRRLALVFGGLPELLFTQRPPAALEAKASGKSH
jgi:GYF domain 2